MTGKTDKGVCLAKCWTAVYIIRNFVTLIRGHLTLCSLLPPWRRWWGVRESTLRIRLLFQTVRYSAFEIHPSSILNSGEDVSGPQTIHLRIFFVTVCTEFPHLETPRARKLLPGASSLGEEGEDGGPGPPAHPSLLDSPGPPDRRPSPWGRAWGTAQVASGPAFCHRSPASHPCSDFAAPGLPGRTVRALGALETASRNCPRCSPARLWGPSQDSGRRRRAGAVTSSQAPGSLSLPPGIPFRSHPPGARSTLPSRPAPGEPRARPLSPDARPGSRTEAATATGQRRGAGSWAGRLGGLFLSLLPPLFLLPPR